IVHFTTAGNVLPEVKIPLHFTLSRKTPHRRSSGRTRHLHHHRGSEPDTDFRAVGARLAITAGEEIGIAEGNIGGDVFLVGYVFTPQGKGQRVETAANGNLRQ